MRSRFKILPILFLLIAALVFNNCGKQLPPSSKVMEHVLKKIDLFEADLNGILNAAEKDTLNINALKERFLAARKSYKEIEFYIEYFFPSSVRVINGAPIAEIELGENLMEPPGGLQVIESLLFAGNNEINQPELINEVKKTSLTLQRVLQYNKEYIITDEQIFDACRLEMLRITALGLAGFDTPLTHNDLLEAASALKGIKNTLSYYHQDKVMLDNFDESIKHLMNARQTDFNYLDFITDHLQPLSRTIDSLRLKLKVAPVSSSSALDNATISLFQKEAISRDKLVNNHLEFSSENKIALGRELFFNPILSRSAKISCASCHKPELAFTDGLRKPKSIDSGDLLRNTPTLLYAGYQRGFFYDLKASSLEDQALDVVHNKLEMDGNLDEVVRTLNRTAIWKAKFKLAFPHKAEIDVWQVQHSLATYIRSLAPFNSRFDRYMQGVESSLTAVEKVGFNLFIGKAKCASCHFMPLFNGTPAPLFDKTEVEVLGIPSEADNKILDRDEGKYSLNPYDQYKFAFKTPTLRNISKTGPYMHNGVYQNLEQVLNFYNKGGGNGLGLDLKNQTLSSDKLLLSRDEIKAIISFLNTLDDQ